MFDLSSKFNTFYRTCVVLPKEEQSDLYDKKELNLKRLKDGMAEYNEEHGTQYAIVDDCVQGSVAMSTIVQNEDKDYDIDVAIVFDESVLEDKGPLATRNMVADALRRKTGQFNAEPEKKTSCVRVKYSEGYHIDFAVYKRIWNKWTDTWIYEHAGADWNQRDLSGLAEWFDQQNKDYEDKLRKMVRLSKMFCNSRDSWKNMPSGLIQTVLCYEKLQSEYDRIDELFYYTMRQIVSRLERKIDVSAPVDNGRALVTRESDRRKIVYWRNRLKSKLDDLEILFQEKCTMEDGMQAWYGFFNHDFWKTLKVSTQSFSSFDQEVIRSYNDTEEFIEDKYPVNKIYQCKLSCSISGKGWRNQSLESFLANGRRFLPYGLKIHCEMTYTDTPSPYQIFWKVKNVGPEAERRNEIRGQIMDRGEAINETTKFSGNHYVECYIIKNNTCVARSMIKIPIGRNY